MIGLPSKFRFQLRNDCGETLDLELNYRAQKLDANGALVYASWVEHWDPTTHNQSSGGYFSHPTTATALIDNTTDLNLGMEVWYKWTLPSSSVTADGLVTLRLQSYFDTDTEYQSDGDGIILSSDYVVSTTNSDTISGYTVV